MIDFDYASLPSSAAVDYLKSRLRTVPDFPKPGIQFKDITTLLADPRALHLCIDLLVQPFIGTRIDAVAAIEARGFIFGGALAARLNTAFVPVRKPGKLPATVDSVSYSLEYGENVLQIHKDALRPGAQVLVVDDLLATGGTAAASAELIARQGADVAAFLFAVELDFLHGRTKLIEATSRDVPVYSLMHIAGEA